MFFPARSSVPCYLLGWRWTKAWKIRWNLWLKTCQWMGTWWRSRIRHIFILRSMWFLSTKWNKFIFSDSLYLNLSYWWHHHRTHLSWLTRQVLKNSRKRDEPDDHTDGDAPDEDNLEPKAKKPRAKAKVKAKAKAKGKPHKDSCNVWVHHEWTITEHFCEQNKCILNNYSAVDTKIVWLHPRLSNLMYIKYIIII